jgi:hypothetical protein
MKMDLREIGLGGMDWIDLVRDRDPCLQTRKELPNFIKS